MKLISMNKTAKVVLCLLLAMPVFAQYRVIYTSTLLGTIGDANVAPGSTQTGTDYANELNAAIAGGRVKLVVDGQYGLSRSLALYSNTEITCVPGSGFIMQPGANSAVLVNAHLNAPTAVNGNGFDVSNQTDAHIRVHGCILNQNSQQSVTGTVNVAHQGNPATGLWVYGLMFSGVDDLVFEHNEVYDTGTFAFAAANVSNVKVRDNYLHQPVPMVPKNTDGIHFFGPSSNLIVTGNRVNAGDDSIAFNADDAQRPTAQNWSWMKHPFIKWGPIVNVFADKNYFDNSIAGYRLYSCDSRIDNVQFLNTSGTTTGESMNFTTPDHDGGNGCGPGNIGKVVIRGWQVNFTGAFTQFYQAGLYISANIKSLEWDDVQITDPGIGWPIFYQQYGTIGNFTHSGWQISTQSTATPIVIQTNGTISNILGVGNIWDDLTSHSGSFYGGTNAPTKITVSGYSGPTRLLASGYSPATQNGDAFATSSAPANVVYVNTSFTEATSGVLTGTTPFVCLNGCVGPWVASAFGGVTVPWSFQNPGVSVSSSPNSFSPMLIDAGVKDYVVRVNHTMIPVGGLDGGQIIVRSAVNSPNYVAVQVTSNNLVVTDASNGTYTNLGSPTAASCGNNPITVVVNGDSIQASCNGMSTGGTLPSNSVNRTSTKLGFLATQNMSWKMNSLQVSSQ